ncbi:F0F1 ATP synthase subunit A [Planomonospora sp. ID91781]|uniref:ATP synthase subunit a n=1 Tax=Planomonospora sphaerica TaxID=161355 RepID=A0A171BQ25_9ACTN|nr:MULTISPECIES: F0F1 ATP synthase subunit A [Planomonospora]MBG0821204.1 F0F1 ATP synthase subunit A [Planomonospora sp. ID91781]GAT65420.1 ATP synthase F0 subunit A [Planomonospora sphaerica]GGL36275.1 ATP synthase subunit a [Planomonospora parontospora subsp. antibiotica]GII17391.1 ATP synthase subunit a [Planomonospora parontospora subsp. antibiotica]
MKALTVLAAPEEFQAPGPELFNIPPIISGVTWLTKPVLLALLSSLVVVVFCWSAFSKPKLVPRGIQNVAEYGYMFVRDQVARPFLGKDTDRWMGLLLSIFFLVWVWNLMGVVPFLQFPVASHIAFPIVLAGTIYLLKIYLGMKHQGPIGYFKNMMFPPGLPKAVYILMAPLELLSNLVVAPFTHAVRLFANMFAGHLILAFFSAVGFWFLFEQLSPLGAPVGVVSVVMTIAMTGLELFIQFLQAFLFAMLAAMYIGGSLHAEH